MLMETVIKCLKNDKFARGAGIELVEVSPGHALVRMTLEPCHHNGIGLAHGGAIFTLADFAFAAASNSYGTVAVAVNVSITFLKATTTGTLQAEAKEVSKSHRLGTYSIQVTDQQGDLVALFVGTAYRKPDPLPTLP